MLQKQRLLIPEALHFTAAVCWLRYHSHLAAHCIALSRISLAEQEERGETLAREVSRSLEAIVDDADWTRPELHHRDWQASAETGSSCELLVAT